MGSSVPLAGNANTAQAAAALAPASTPRPAVVKPALAVVKSGDVFIPTTNAAAPRIPFGVSDKFHGHSGYFAYELCSDGKIYSKWEPTLAPKPFYLTRIEKEDPRALQARLNAVVGPYTYTYEPANKRILVTPRQQIPAKGYVTHAGRLVPRTNEPEWHLFDGAGGPKLPKGVRLVEMQVGSDIIMARASNGSMYIYQPTTVGEPGEWKEALGCPWDNPLTIPLGTDWSMGVSISGDKKKATLEFMNPYTDITSYAETATGMKVVNGLTVSWVVRNPDGHTFSMGDTGLNADMQRRFLTPHHGQFYAPQAPTGAGSTWLLYGFEPDGTPAMYTRRYDYEIFGGCPDTPHTYEPQSFDPNTVYNLDNKPRDVPLMPWQKVDFPTLVGKSQLTTAMSVHTTGEGNASREFHIAGTKDKGNGELEIGYYYKAINDKVWRFAATPGVALQGEVIDFSKKGPTTDKPITFDYPQSNGSGLSRVKNIELLDFHPFQTADEPSRVVFTLLSGKKVEINVHTVDAYSLFNNDPAVDAALLQGIGEDKALMGTLDIPKTLIDAANAKNADPELAHLIKQLLPYNRVANLFSVAADRDHVVVQTNGRFTPFGGSAKKLPELRVNFYRDATGETPYDKKCDDPNLVVKPNMSPAALQQVIALNKKAAKEIIIDMNTRRLQHVQRWTDHVVLDGLLRALLWLAALIRLNHIWTNLTPAKDSTPRIELSQELAARDVDFTKVPAYTRALKRLNANIAAAEQLCPAPRHAPVRIGKGQARAI